MGVCSNFFPNNYEEINLIIFKIKEIIYQYKFLLQPRLLLITILTALSLSWICTHTISLVFGIITSIFGPPPTLYCPYFLGVDSMCDSPLPFNPMKRLKFGEAFLSESCGSGIILSHKCDAYFEGCQLYPAIGGVNMYDPDDLPALCSYIKDRQYFPSSPLSEEERDFPIAFVKTVKEDYYYLEMELAATYAPQNFYCFSIDTDATDLFKEKMRNLTQCFPNVYIGTKEYDMKKGKNQLFAYLNCVKQLTSHKWKYVFLLEVTASFI